MQKNHIRIADTNQCHSSTTGLIDRRSQTRIGQHLIHSHLSGLIGSHTESIIKATPTRGEAFCFCTLSSAGPPRMAAASHPYLVTLISAKPLFQFIWCSTYWIQVIIHKLHQFFRKFGKLFGSWRPSLIFFVKLEPCHPDIYKTALSIHFVFNILDTSINSYAASIFSESLGKYSGHGGHL